MVKTLKRILRAFDIRDAHCYGGIILIAIGFSFVYWPAALIVTGLILLYLALRRVNHGYIIESGKESEDRKS